ncbi:MAG: ion channel [Myxococcota bacterium]
MSERVRFRASYTGFLGILVSALVVLPLLELGDASVRIVKAALVVAVLGALVRLKPHPGVLAVAIAAGAVSAGATAASLWLPARGWVVADHLAGLTFLMTVAATITWNVWREREVTPDTIVGGLAVYVLIGMSWSIAYQLLEFSVPGSIVVVGGGSGHWGAWETAPGKYPRLLFFSFVTLTTLGYGDIVPASAPAAALSSIEAVVGPVYLTVLIARLVGLEVTRTRSLRDDRGRRGGA